MKKKEIIEKIDSDNLISKNKTARLIIEQCMSEYAAYFAKFLLENAILNTRGKLYLKLTDTEINQIITNAMKDYENT